VRSTHSSWATRKGATRTRIGSTSCHYEGEEEETMTKKNYIALADMIRQDRALAGAESVFTDWVVSKLADFVLSQNDKFNRDRWLTYIKEGTNK
jgi:hypothetical protein